jgi:uncharacterized membrane protein YeaQ/YmgE (transglycosylase-associated protein family)
MITSLVVGVLIGWVASVRERIAGREDLMRNLALGITGAFAGSWLLGKLVQADQGGFSVGVTIASSLGAATAIFIVTRLNRA